MTEAPVLEARDILVRFGGVHAVDEVSLLVRDREIHGLIGPNGSGKTTLLNAITGFVRLRSGDVFLGGLPITRWSVHRRAKAGISRTFQGASVFNDMSVLENVVVGLQSWDRQSFARSVVPGLGDRDGAALVEQARAALGEVGLTLPLATPALELTFVQQRYLDLARAIVGEPRILLLDEPVAGLPASEVSALTNVVRRLRERGWSILLVEHHMQFVMGLCDRITVLDFGRRIASGPPEAVQTDSAVVEAYLGPDHVHVDAV